MRPELLAKFGRQLVVVNDRHVARIRHIAGAAGASWDAGLAGIRSKESGIRQSGDNLCCVPQNGVFEVQVPCPM